MAAFLRAGKLTLTGDVGVMWFGDGFTHGDVVLALGQIGDEDDLTVHINSGGGIATEGSAIYALLKDRAGKTDVVIEGIAASAASLIAMAGETVTMSEGSVMMIHDPSVVTIGNSDDHSKSVEMLEALATSYARVYATKSGKAADDCRSLMKNEFWMTPEQAVEEGFADATNETKAAPVAAFDYRIFAQAPKNLKALAKKKNWSIEAKLAASAASSGQKKETSMPTDKERADQLAAENDKLKKDLEEATASADTAVKADRERRGAIMALEETKSREALAEHLFTAGSSVEQAKATLSAAPMGESATEEFRPRRTNAQGLNNDPAGGKPAAKGERVSFLSSAVERLNKRR